MELASRPDASQQDADGESDDSMTERPQAVCQCVDFRSKALAKVFSGSTCFSREYSITYIQFTVSEEASRSSSRSDKSKEAARKYSVVAGKT
jgi:hypothetical protein